MDTRARALHPVSSQSSSETLEDTAPPRENPRRRLELANSAKNLARFTARERSTMARRASAADGAKRELSAASAYRYIARCAQPDGERSTP